MASLVGKGLRAHDTNIHRVLVIDGYLYSRIYGIPAKINHLFVAVGIVIRAAHS